MHIGPLWVVALIAPCLSAPLPDKDRYDIRTGAAKTAGFTDQKTLNDGKIEATLIEGGYFTLGTRQGLSASPIDDLNTLTYGHPFAKTSYPLLAVDGKWTRPEAIAGGTFKSLGQTSKALSVEYALPGGLTFRFSVELDSAHPGALAIRSEFANSSATAATVHPGLMLDPGLGWAGQDAEAFVAGSPVTRETSSNPAAIELWERGAGHKGLGLSLAFDAAATNKIDFANWHRFAQDDNAALNAAAAREFYDLALRIDFKAISVPAGGKASVQATVALAAPDFGSGPFLRWDFPRAFSAAGGQLYPQDFPTTLRAFNAGTAASPSQVTTMLPYEIALDTPSASLSAAAGQWAFATRTAHVRENYSKDTVLTIRAKVVQGQAAPDSLSFRVFQPASPYSDEGLAVSIDSAYLAADGTARLLFNARKAQSGQSLFGLGKENVVLRENGNPVADFAVGKDTTGGATQLDVVFVLDVTGSMTEEINGVKNNIQRFADSLSVQGVDYQFGMVTFLDAIETTVPLTSDLQKFKDKVGEQYAHGGGDGPENSLDALSAAASLQFRTGSKVIFIWITDADYHQADAVTAKTADRVLPTLLARDIQVFCIGTPTYDAAFYSPIYQPAGGSFYDITGNFQDILLDIAGMRYSSGMMLTYRPAGGALAGRVTLEVHAAGLGGKDTLDFGAAPAPKLAAADQSLRVVCAGYPCDLAGALGPGSEGTLDLYDMRGMRLRSLDWGRGGSRSLDRDPAAGLRKSDPGMLFFTFRGRSPGLAPIRKRGQILLLNRN